MKRRLKGMAAIFAALLALMAVPVYAAGEDTQVLSIGGTNGSLETDWVEVGKTVYETGIENYFDITLTARTRTERSEETYDGNLAVVLVLDLSNTMNYVFGESRLPNEGEGSRYDAAMQAAETFIAGFEAITPDDSHAYRHIGVAAFNTSGHIISGMTECRTETHSAALISKVKSGTKAIVGASEYSSSRSRFTNMEAGLKAAKDMLGGVSEVTPENKIIIFITDGYPTTYLNNSNGSGYEGYEPFSTAADTPGADGVFYDGSGNGGVYCLYGTDYSDKGAERAAAMAADIRSSGIDIYAVGVDVEDQFLGDYEAKNYGEGKNVSKGFSTIDTVNGNYVIDDFTDWLSGTDTNKGIASGEGFYYPGESAGELVDALKSIFNSINRERISGTTAISALDPVYSRGMGDYIEFVGFFAKAGTDSPFLAEGDLRGSGTAWGSEDAENTAAISETGGKNTISWDLANSAYSVDTLSEGEKQINVYTYTLKYRIRLKNERDGFAASGDYSTNDTTVLKYENTEKEGAQTIEYPLPMVNGYFGSFAFKKIDSATGAALSGAEFALKHADDCEWCERGGCQVEIEDITAASGGDGMVSFLNIPSGHGYILTETRAPQLHHILRETYDVRVAYGKVSVSGGGDHFSDTLEGMVISNDSVLPGDVTVTVKKLLNGKTPPDGRFEFTLTDEDGRIQTSKATGGEASFVLNFKGAEVDTARAYRYTLREVKPGGRYTYDDTVYTAVITFSGSGEDYTATVEYYKGETVSEGNVPLEGVPTFHNRTRSSDPTPTVIIKVPPKTGGYSGLGFAMTLMFAAVSLMAQSKRRNGKR